MNKEKATELIKESAQYYPGVTKFFVTDDEKIFTDANKAVGHAVTLCSGNPKVETVELDEPAAPNVDEATRQKLEKDSKIKAAKEKITSLKKEIDEHDDDSEINEHNMAAKMHVAGLKEQLQKVEAELDELQETK